MLVLAALLPALVALDVVIFDNGDINIVDQTMIDPDDDVFVVGGPPNMMDGTTVIFEDTATMQSLTIQFRGNGRLFDSSRVLGDVTIESGGLLFFQNDSVVDGGVDVLAGGNALIGTSGSVESVRVRAGGNLGLSNAVRVTGDLVVEGTAEISGGVIEGTATFRNTPGRLTVGAEFMGPVVVEGASALEISSASFSSGLTQRDTSNVRLRTGVSFTSTLTLEDASIAVLLLRSSNLGFGDVEGSSGVLIGTDADGQPVSLAFQRSPGTRLVLAEYSDQLGTSFCTQPVANTAGLFGRMSIGGTLDADAGLLVLRASDMPNFVFGYFALGTQRASTPLGNSLVCVGGNVGRLNGPGQVLNSMTTGAFELSLSFDALPGVPSTVPMAGDTYVFQVWHRAHSLATSNFTDAVELTFE
ncbi:MAG: hypothetical protein AAF726_24920 [Planctomycetota bacterium]